MLTTCIIDSMLTWYNKLLSHSLIHVTKDSGNQVETHLRVVKNDELAKISRDTPGAHNTTNSIRFVYVAFQPS